MWPAKLIPTFQIPSNREVRIPSTAAAFLSEMLSTKQSNRWRLIIVFELFRCSTNVVFLFPLAPLVLSRDQHLVEVSFAFSFHVGSTFGGYSWQTGEKDKRLSCCPVVRFCIVLLDNYPMARVDNPLS